METFSTDGTLERFHSFVGFLMDFKVNILAEALPTLQALVRSLPGVDAAVDNQLRLEEEALPAVRAFV